MWRSVEAEANAVAEVEAEAEAEAGAEAEAEAEAEAGAGLGLGLGLGLGPRLGPMAATTLSSTVLGIFRAAARSWRGRTQLYIFDLGLDHSVLPPPRNSAG